VVVVPAGTSSAPNCAGRGQAAPGFLCLYETVGLNGALAPSNVFTGLANNQVGTSTVGFIPEVLATSTASRFDDFGTWTVTAP